ncbi:MAG: ABC transporter ATP-binding protein [Phycisphaerae bacterium]|nr:ABC transporter ATP-binding protein [Phycisphaerae bacterium]
MEPIIRVQGLAKSYGPVQAVRGIDLEVQGGEVFALLGPNGAGKTTTIRMLMGILQPSSGRASIGGLDCSSDRAEIMRQVGYLPDEPIFYDYLRGREIVHFVGQMHGLDRLTIDQRCAPLVGRLDLGEAMEDYAVNYSHGMKKKLAVICALLHQPNLLILDEPTSGLDPFATREVHALIRAHATGGGSVFLSTHLLDQAERLCHRVGILLQGRLAACGALAELRKAAREDSSLEEIFFAVAAGAQADGPATPGGTPDAPAGGSGQ